MIGISERGKLGTRRRLQASDILKMEDHEVMSLRSNGLPEKILDEMYLHRQKLEGPVPLLFGGTHVVMDKKNNKIVFGKKSQLDGYGKMIILSATANKKLYEDYFKGHRVIFRSIHNAKYKGKVVQYTAHSLSRTFFMANGMSEVIKQDMKLRYFDAPDLKELGNNAYRFVNAVSDFATHAEPRRKTANYRENMFAKTADGNPLIDKAYQLVTAA